MGRAGAPVCGKDRVGDLKRVTRELPLRHPEEGQISLGYAKASTGSCPSADRPRPLEAPPGLTCPAPSCGGRTCPTAGCAPSAAEGCAGAGAVVAPPRALRVGAGPGLGSRTGLRPLRRRCPGRTRPALLPAAARAGSVPRCSTAAPRRAQLGKWCGATRGCSPGLLSQERERPLSPSPHGPGR